MDLVKRITENLKICLRNRAEEQALENMLYAKMAHLFALKNITFVSVNNLQKPALLSYYAINFVNSGGQKNEAIKHIDNYVIPFINDEYFKLNDIIRESELEREISLLNPESKNYEKDRDLLTREYADVQILSFRTNGGTPASLYSKLEKIEKFQRGALFAQITEFSDYFRGSVENASSSNNTFLDMLKGLYDGTFEVNDSLGTQRRELNNLPFSLLFLSDIEELLEPKNNKIFKIRLKNGLARRVNFYINKEINYAKNPPERPTIEQKKQAYSSLRFISEELKQIYDNLPFGSQFEFTDEANRILEQWDDQCSEEVSKFYAYSDILSLDDKIKEIELSNSTWKIIKLAVIIQILMNQRILSVTPEAVLYAIDFYKKCRASLYSILAEKQITEEESLYNFFLNNQNIEFNKTAIKRQNFVSREQFPRWFQAAIIEVAGMLEEKGYELICEKKSRNEYKYICVKAKNPEDDLINVSVLKTNNEKISKGYEFKSLTTPDFLELITKNYSISAGKFKDGHRKKINYLGEQNTIWLDFDDGLTIEQAQELFKDYWYIIYTSRNHQKEKNNKINDRFRVILKIKDYMPSDIDEYSNIMSNIQKYYGADKQCCDCSRFYFGNENAKVFYNNGKYFDISNFKNTPVIKNNTINQKEDIWGNAVCESTGGLTDENIFTSRADEILKSSDIYQGNRDGALKYTVGVLIAAVKEGNLSHNKAIDWLTNKLNEVITPDFEQNAKKYMKRLVELKF